MKYSEDVMEVHNEFMTAGDTALELANKILNTEVKVDPKKVERLTNFGFKTSKDVTAIADNKKEKDFQSKLIEAISYYRIKFPNYKFVPESTVKAICEKYGLVSGEAHQYKGFVPDKNLTEIERFFEAYPDMKQTYWRKPVSNDGIISWARGDVKITKEEFDEIENEKTKQENIASLKEAPKKAVQSFKKGLDKDIPVAYPFMGYGPYREDNSIGRMFTTGRRTGMAAWYDEILKSSMYYSFGMTTDNTTKTAYKKDTTLRICAPVTEMVTSGYELEDGYKLVYDPIVSIEVTHENGVRGEIILTAWGDEASDELVVNQNNN